MVRRVKKCKVNFISFSLFGANPMYHVGAIRNAEQIRKFYPGFVPVFYIGPGVPDLCIKGLEKLGAKLVYDIDANKIPDMMMWRFAALEIPQADIVLVRDADSRFSDREVHAVEQWLKSDRLFHVMRDYAGHCTTIMAGMWGWKKELGPLGMYDELVNWFQQDPGRAKTTNDQQFLARVVWPKIKHSVMQHDSFFRDRYPGAIPFPDGDKSVSGSFVGEVIYENEKPQKYTRQARRAGKRADEIVWSNEECAKYE